MTLLNTIVIEPFLVIWIAGILGLIVGSFLNVVVYRLPIMMEHEWQTQCAQFLKIANNPVKPTFNLLWPPSHCPHCQHKISILENIPLFSYLWQRGRCQACQQKISPRYPLVEGLSALLAMLTAGQLGLGWPLLAALIFTWALLASSMIDIEHQLLPDNIILPLLWLGLLCNYFQLFTDLNASLLGAIIGYTSLWSVYWLFKIITGKEGMGYGDFKLFAALGAWLGWQALLGIILIASLTGAIIGVTLILSQQQNKETPIPFGPFLAIAGWLSFLWADKNIYSLPWI